MAMMMRCLILKLLKVTSGNSDDKIIIKGFYSAQLNVEVFYMVIEQANARGP